MIKKKKRRSREFKNNSRVIDIKEARETRKQKRDQAAVKKDRKQKTVITERQAGKKARRRMVYFLVFLFILCITGVSVFNVISLEITKARTIKEQQDLMQQKAQLERVYSQVSSPEYIEQKARQQLKMIKPGEILYILPDKNKKATGSGIVPK